MCRDGPSELLTEATISPEIPIPPRAYFPVHFADMPSRFIWTEGFGAVADEGTDEDFIDET